ncbi:MAG: hypothetical protein HXY18_11420 [Bryobacteraceae bacterium]|nr:hypothetical protein [Bryobacteraceae bacterium]
MILGNLAVVYLDQGKHRPAEKAILRSISHEENAANLSVYAELLRRTNRRGDAAQIDIRIRSLREPARIGSLNGNPQPP